MWERWYYFAPTASVPAPMAMTELDPAAWNIRIQISTAIFFDNPPIADPIVYTCQQNVM